MVEAMTPLGTYGVWRGRAQLTPEIAAAVERLGYGTLWIGGSPGAQLEEVEMCLDATEHIAVATGIVNIWRADAAETAASFHRIEARHPGRLLLGVGIGHPENDSMTTRPLTAMSRYLDVLDAEGVPKGRRMLAALGPKALELAADRTLGTHPYLTPPVHTRWAREVIGPDAVIAAEQMVIGHEDAETARKIGRGTLRGYLRMSNYRRMLEESGFDAADIDDDGSDRLIDALTVWGPTATLAAAAEAHVAAGADHVCVQVLPQREDPVPVLEQLAGAFGLG